MRVVVTGGAGFIGANLCRRLSGHPQIGSICVLDDLSTGASAALTGLDLELRVGSVLDIDAVDSSVAGADTVVHLAGRGAVGRSLADPLRSHEVNATGTLLVLEAARRHGAAVVVASSSSVYGDTVELPKREDQPARPRSPYAASKAAAEAYAFGHAASFDVPGLVFRLFNAYGPLQTSGHPYAAVIPTFIAAACTGVPLTVHGDGRQTRDFTYVGTVCDVLAEAVLRRVRSEGPVNLAYGSPVSLLDIVGQLGDLLGRELPVEFTAVRRGDVKDSAAACELLTGLFPAVEPVPLRDGLRQTLEWYLSTSAAPADRSGRRG
jgi:UDP-glucose 4-epimerase